jgi:hypothetical protein
MKDTEISLDMFSKDQLFELMVQAHERDITLNQLVNELIRNELEKINAGIKDGSLKAEDIFKR